MRIRLVFFSLAFLSLPLFSQQASTAARVDQWIWSRGKMMKADTPPDLDLRAARAAAIRRDATELSTLSGSVQSDLQQLQKGILARDLQQRLKRMEKLSKKLRQEMEP
jgi:hypothetical protein